MTENGAAAAIVSDQGLESRLEFETLISDASAALFAASPEGIETEVERCLERVRRFFRADRGALLCVSPDQQSVNVRIACYADGLVPVPKELNLAPVFPWSFQRLILEHLPVRVSNPAELPPDGWGSVRPGRNCRYVPR